jgi:hypothetical protein
LDPTFFMIFKTNTKVARLYENGARFRGYCTEYVWWMGALTVQVNSIQLKAHVGTKVPESRKTRRGNRGRRAGKFRARMETSLRAESSAPTPKTPANSRKRFMTRVERIRSHCYKICCRWQGTYVMRFRCSCLTEDHTSVCMTMRNKWSQARVDARARGLHDLLVNTISKCRTLVLETGKRAFSQELSDYLLRKNKEWSNFLQAEEREGPPTLVVAEEKKIVVKPGNRPGMLSLDCPECGRIRISVTSTCGCGFKPARRVPYQVVTSNDGNNSRGSGRRGAFRGATSTRGRASKNRKR